MLGLMIALIIGLNNLTFHLVTKPQNIGTAQMIYGWGRLYKPMIYDSSGADMVSFGFSWVRDIFDPVPVQALTGKKFFNFGISGATSFESLRLVQNAIYVHKPKEVLLNLGSFYDAPIASRLEHQFDERILYVNRDGSVNTKAGLNRLVKINTSGAALGFNFAFLEALWRNRRGTPMDEILPSYERRDWRDFASTAQDFRDWMTVPYAPSMGASGRGSTIGPMLNDLKAAVGLLCDAGVDIHLYQSPYICGGDGAQTRAGLTLMREMAKSCKSSISFHSFNYPNAVTLEGVVITPGLSTFYRPDGHPRPPLGQLMLTRIFGLEHRPGAPPLPADFGADLMKLDAVVAENWIATRAARCYGHWEDGEYQRTLEEARQLTPVWQSLWNPHHQ